MADSTERAARELCEDGMIHVDTFFELVSKGYCLEDFIRELKQQESK